MAKRTGTAPSAPEKATSDSIWSPLFELWLIRQAVYPLIERTIGESGLTSGDEYGLYLLLESFGPVTPGNIARGTGMRGNTVSAMLNRIEKRGHIERAANPVDRRSVLVSLSPEGREVMETARVASRALDEQLRSMVDIDVVQAGLDELQTAIRLLSNLPPRPRI